VAQPFCPTLRVPRSLRFLQGAGVSTITAFSFCAG
jgi:hypothetical protein